MNEVLIDENIVGDELTPKQEQFCRNYTQIASLFGNATLSYAEAYGVDLDSLDDERPVLAENTEGEPIEWGKSDRQIAYDTCASAGSRLLRNVKVDKRVRVLLNEMLNDEVIDARLMEIILNGKDQDSIKAIMEANKLKQRIVEKKDITSGGEKIAGFNFIRADYVDSRTPEERGADSKIETVTTTASLPEPTIVRLPTIDLSENNNSNNQTNT